MSILDDSILGTAREIVDRSLLATPVLRKRLRSLFAAADRYEEEQSRQRLIRQLAREEAEKVHAEKVAAQNFTQTVVGEGPELFQWGYKLATLKRRRGRKK